MTNKPLKPEDVPYDVAQQVVDKESAARKDGLTVPETDTGSGIVMKPDPNDRSVRTYDPADIEHAKDVKPEKSPYKSGEPVSDRS